MKESSEYVLGQSERAARRLAIQDEQFAAVSERLLDELDLPPGWRVVELGCGPGAFSRRVLRRLGPGGVLVGVDSSADLLCRRKLLWRRTAPLNSNPCARISPSLGPGSTARTPSSAEPFCITCLWWKSYWAGCGRPSPPEPRLALSNRISAGRWAASVIWKQKANRKWRPCAWAFAINQLYLARRLSPDVGASLARTLEVAGYSRVRATWEECPATATTLENMGMFYDEVREKLAELGILSVEETDRQKALLASLAPESLPPAWGTYRVTCET